MTQTKTILIAEDEAAIGRALQLKLTHEGFDVTLMTDGQQALEAIEKKSYDLILTDLVMPNLDGFGMLEALKGKKDVPKVLVLSNLSQAEDEEKAKALGAAGFFIKSNTPLHNIVEEVKKAVQ